MAATDVNPIRETTATARPVERVRRWADETKSAFKTTELYIYVAALVGVLIAGAATKAGSGHDDRFVSTDVWLYATILTVGYLLSRGLAKAGSTHRGGDDEDVR